MQTSSAFLIFLFLVGSGCRFISSDDAPDPAAFEVTAADVELEGSVRITVEGSDLRVRGEFLHPDSTRRFLELTLDAFAGENLYPLRQRAGTYGIVTDSSETMYGVSAGHPDDQVRISTYDADEGVMRGELFFYGEAVLPFDDIPRFDAFTVRGRFRGDVE